MSSVKLLDGRVLHMPASIPNATDTIPAQPDAELVAAVPLIPPAELLLFTGRLVAGARKRRRQERWAEVNAARLRLARACIDRALVEWERVQRS